MLSYSNYLQTIFPGIKVQKISVNAGFSCPNRDGTIGTTGCSYCRNDSFSPSYCLQGDGIITQIEKGKLFFSRKYPSMKYIVYFQSYTNTYGRPLKEIEKLYEAALGCTDVVGLAIATRPDTLDDNLLDYLANINSHTPVFLEIGAESTNDLTLKLVNRGHQWEDVVQSVKKASLRNLHCGLHLIAGLPGEGKFQIIENVKKVCMLPIETLKLHHLQILKDTPLYNSWIRGAINVRPLELEEYLEICEEVCEIVPDNIIIERFLSQSPPDLVIAPKWGLKNYQFMQLLNNRLRKRGIILN